MNPRNERLGFVILAGTCCAITFFSAPASGLAQTGLTLRQPASIVTPEEVEIGSGSFRVSNDQAISAPAHPPLNTIPPIPSPIVRAAAAGDNLRPVPDPGPGFGVAYNPATGAETRGVPFQAIAGAAESAQGGGYWGADGGGAAEASNDSQRMNGSMKVVSNTAIDPWRKSVKLVVRFQNTMGQDEFYSCSGTMRDAETVLTAGHCICDSGPGGKGWAREVWVYPGWDGEGGQFPEIVNPYGLGHAKTSNLYSWSQWIDDRNVDFDIGAVVIDRGVGMLTGWFGWRYGNDCSFHLGKTYQSAGFPAERCNDLGLHDGGTMYSWLGNIDACEGNRFKLNTSAGCTNAIWGGQDGSGLYYTENGNEYVTAVMSASDKATVAYYARQFQGWVEYTEQTIVPTARGSSFDLQPLEVDAAPSNVEPGDNVTIQQFLAINATNGTANKKFTYGVYLSSNNSITPSDTLLKKFSHTTNFTAMSRIFIGPATVKIPQNTPPGDYFLGVIYDDATDATASNNATNTWDAFSIHVNAPGVTPPPPCECPLMCTVREPAGLPAAVRDTLPAGIELASFLHQYRDQVMSQSPLGRRYVELYYEHGPELSRLIPQRPAVASGSSEMLVRIMPQIVSLMEGGNVELTSDDRRAAMNLIETVHRHASPQLRTALTEVRADLAAGRLNGMFSDDVTSAGTVLAATALRWTGIGLIFSAGLMAMFWRRGRRWNGAAA